MKILLRTIPPGVERIIDKFKKEQSIKVNTDAVISMLEKYEWNKNVLEQYKIDLEMQTSRADQLENALEHYIQCQSATQLATEHLKQLLSNNFVDKMKGAGS